MHSPDFIKTTCKVQPAILLFSTVSIFTKLASKRLPSWQGNFIDTLLAFMLDWKLLCLIFIMFAILGIYAVIWQRLIKNANIAAIYANKSSTLLWQQGAAVLLFGEQLSLVNMLGIFIILTGILLANGGVYEHA